MNDVMDESRGTTWPVMERRRASCTLRFAASLVVLACVGLVAERSVGQEASRPLSLKEAVERALCNAPEIGLARALADESRARVREAASGFQPQGFVTTTPGYSSGIPVAVAGQVPAVAGVKVRQTLYDAPRRSDVWSAEAQAVEAEARVAVARADVAKNVVAAYARVAADAKDLEIARRRIQAREALLRRCESLRREGRRTDLDVARAELELSKARHMLTERESDAKLHDLSLRALFGASSEMERTVTVTTLDECAAATPVAMERAMDTLARARANDPQLAAMAAERSALQKSAVLEARFLQPTLEAEFQYSRLSRANNYDEYYATFKADDWSVGLALILPFWSGGRRPARMARANARLARLEAEERLRTTELDLSVARAESELERALSRVDLAKRGRRVAEQALRVTRLLAQEGRGEPDDTEMAELALAAAEEELGTAELATILARASLLALRGDLEAAVTGKGDDKGRR